MQAFTTQITDTLAQLTPAEKTALIGWLHELHTEVTERGAAVRASTGQVDPFLLAQRQELDGLIMQLGLLGIS